MPLVATVWQAQLSAAMEAMYSMTAGGDDYLGTQIASTFASYLAMGIVSSTDMAPAVPGGTSYVGAGVGTMVIVPATLAASLNAHFKACNGDDDGLATNIAADIDTACSSATITITSTGVAMSTASPPVPFPFAGSGSGFFKGVKSLIEMQLKAIFKSMGSAPEQSNMRFAQALATSVTSYLTAGMITVTLSPPFVGGTGSGVIA